MHVVLLIPCLHGSSIFLTNHFFYFKFMEVFEVDILWSVVKQPLLLTLILDIIPQVLQIHSLGEVGNSITREHLQSPPNLIPKYWRLVEFIISWALHNCKTELKNQHIKSVKRDIKLSCLSIN